MNRSKNINSWTLGRCFLMLLSIFLVFPLSRGLLVDNARAESMQSARYKMESDSLNFGGGRSSSESYVIEDTAGEIATGISSSTNYVMKAGYQQMNEVYISVTPASNVAMDPAIPGLTGGTSDGSAVFTVVTDSSSGYTATVAAENSPALQSASDSFADYVPTGADPDFTFTNASNASSFALSPEGSDIVSRFKNDGASCGTGSNTSGACWDGLSTTPETIVSRNSSNHPDGTATTLRFKAASGGDHEQLAGVYTATTTITVLAQ